MGGKNLQKRKIKCETSNIMVAIISWSIMLVLHQPKRSEQKRLCLLLLLFIRMMMMRMMKYILLHNKRHSMQHHFRIRFQTGTSTNALQFRVVKFLVVFHSLFSSLALKRFNFLFLFVHQFVQHFIFIYIFFILSSCNHFILLNKIAGICIYNFCIYHIVWHRLLHVFGCCCLLLNV